MQKVHDICCIQDDSIRMAHIAKFRFNNVNVAKEFSATVVKAGLPKNMEGKLTMLLTQSLSNGFEIENF
ncbi:MAG: hypothetical protein RSE25_10580, partial [Bacteroidales bacterium]